MGSLFRGGGVQVPRGLGSELARHLHCILPIKASHKATAIQGQTVSASWEGAAKSRRNGVDTENNGLPRHHMCPRPAFVLHSPEGPLTTPSVPPTREEMPRPSGLLDSGFELTLIPGPQVHGGPSLRGDPWSQIVLELGPESHHGEPGGLTNHMGHVCTFSTCGWKTGGLRLAPALAVGGYGRGRGGASGTTLSTKAASESSLPGGDSGPVSPSGTWESPPTSPLSSPAGPRRAQAGLGE